MAMALAIQIAVRRSWAVVFSFIFFSLVGLSDEETFP
jgi:hypothetical protein